MKVEVGARVVRGQTLFTDRHHGAVCFASPVSGVIDALTYGPRRTLDVLVIRLDAEVAGDAFSPDNSARTDPRDVLMTGGFWPAFRARPFGCIPAPDARPEAIVVNAVQAAPQSPDPALVLEGQREAFLRGCEALTRLTEGPVHICQSPGLPLGSDSARIRHTSFSGTMAAGLVGTQIDRLCRGMNVWSVGYQDVAAIGHYLEAGEYLGQHVASVTGPMASPPSLIRIPHGARITDLVAAGPVRAVAGNAGAEREAMYVGRFDDQIRLLVDGVKGHLRGFYQRRAGHSAAVPSRALDRAVAVDVLPVPLLRALSLGDAQAAERLGCLALVEEDVATATHVCTSGTDYGACLRGVLTELMAEAA